MGDAVNTLVTNMDKQCAECRKPGATGSGICLECATKAISGKVMKTREGRFIQIQLRRGKANRPDGRIKQPGGDMRAAIEKASENLKILLENHEEEINNAYLSGAEDLGVSISVGVGIEPGPSIGAYVVTTKINFVESRVKDEITQVVDNNQLRLGLPEAEEA